MHMIQVGDGTHAKYFLHSTDTGIPIFTSHVKRAMRFQEESLAEYAAWEIGHRSGEKCKAVKYEY